MSDAGLSLDLCRHSSLKQKHASENMMKMISGRETELASALEAANRQLAEVNAQLAEMRLSSQGSGNDNTEADCASTIDQVADEQAALNTSRKVLGLLLERTKNAARDVQEHGDRPVFVFGALGKGLQIGTNSGSISGISF